MWVPQGLIALFDISKETVDTLRQELSAARAERDILKNQLTAANVNVDWLRMKVNSLELERAGLIEKAYAIKLPSVPELQRVSTPVDPQMFNPDTFTDIGDDVAKALGYPTHAISNNLAFSGERE